MRPWLPAKEQQPDCTDIAATIPPRFAFKTSTGRCIDARVPAGLEQVSRITGQPFASTANPIDIRAAQRKFESVSPLSGIWTDAEDLPADIRYPARLDLLSVWIPHEQQALASPRLNDVFLRTDAIHAATGGFNLLVRLRDPTPFGHYVIASSDLEGITRLERTGEVPPLSVFAGTGMLDPLLVESVVPFPIVRALELISPARPQSRAYVRLIDNYAAKSESVPDQVDAQRLLIEKDQVLVDPMTLSRLTTTGAQTATVVGVRRSMPLALGVILRRVSNPTDDRYGEGIVPGKASMPPLLQCGQVIQWFGATRAPANTVIQKIDPLPGQRSQQLYQVTHIVAAIYPSREGEGQQPSERVFMLTGLTDAAATPLDTINGMLVGVLEREAAITLQDAMDHLLVRAPGDEWWSTPDRVAAASKWMSLVQGVWPMFDPTEPLPPQVADPVRRRPVTPEEEERWKAIYESITAPGTRSSFLLHEYAPVLVPKWYRPGIVVVYGGRPRGTALFSLFRWDRRTDAWIDVNATPAMRRYWNDEQLGSFLAETDCAFTFCSPPSCPGYAPDVRLVPVTWEPNCVERCRAISSILPSECTLQYLLCSIPENVGNIEYLSSVWYPFARGDWASLAETSTPNDPGQSALDALFDAVQQYVLFEGCTLSGLVTRLVDSVAAVQPRTYDWATRTEWERVAALAVINYYVPVALMGARPVFAVPHSLMRLDEEGNRATIEQAIVDAIARDRPCTNRDRRRMLASKPIVLV